MQMRFTAEPASLHYKSRVNTSVDVGNPDKKLLFKVLSHAEEGLVKLDI